jgi:hypothetical protein
MEQEAETMMKPWLRASRTIPSCRTHRPARTGDAAGRLLRECIEALGGSDAHRQGAVREHDRSDPRCRQHPDGDEVVKSIGISFGFENTEIATYRALVIAAERAAAPDIAAVCSQILQEEIAMARWLEEHQDSLVGAFLNRDETPGAQAKR